MAATNINRSSSSRATSPGIPSCARCRAACPSARCGSPPTRAARASPASGRTRPNYFDVTVWGAQGENCARFLSKGRPVALNGRLEWREWQAQDGAKRQTVEIIADSVQFLGGRDEGQGGGGNGFTPQSDVPVNNSDFQPVARPPAPPPRTTTSPSRPLRTRSRRPALRRRPLRVCHNENPAPCARRLRAPHGRPVTRSTRKVFKWQSSAAGRRAGVTRRVGPVPVAGSRASTAATRSSTSTTRTSRRSASSSRTAARSARAASRARAAGTRTRSPRRSSVRVRWPCCRTWATRASRVTSAAVGGIVTAIATATAR